jgi:hypothetical protein
MKIERIIFSSLYFIDIYKINDTNRRANGTGDNHV